MIAVTGFMPAGLALTVRAMVADSAKGPRPSLTETLFALANLTHISLWEVHAIVGHHSNGQDGCLSTEQQRVDLPGEDDPCLPEGVVPTQATINRVDGSFSTNYIRVGMNYSWNRLEPGGGPAKGACNCEPDEAEGVEERRLKAEIEYHPAPWIDDDIEDRSARAAHQLGLGSGWNLKVHSAQRSPAVVVGQVRLRDHRLEPVRRKLLLAKGARKKAARVVASLDIEDERAFEPGLGEDHPPAPASGFRHGAISVISSLTTLQEHFLTSNLRSAKPTLPE